MIGLLKRNFPTVALLVCQAMLLLVLAILVMTHAIGDSGAIATGLVHAAIGAAAGLAGFSMNKDNGAPAH